MNRVGRHKLVDFHGIAAEILRDEQWLMEAAERALDTAGFHRLRSLSHRFRDGGQGVTGVVLLTESHLAFHSYPEHGYLALDLFSCGSADPERALSELTAALAPERVVEFERGRGDAGPRHDAAEAPVAASS